MVSVLCVCTYNRTRSVMMAALLGRHLADLGVAATVRSAGTAADGGLATGDTVRLLGDRGLDVRGHRGTALSDDLVLGSDLVVTAEQDHVVTIATRWPGSFRHTFTLPEIVARSGMVGGRLGGPIDDWLALVNDGRRAGFEYLDDRSIGEITDPTGHGRRTWSEVFAKVDDLTLALARALT